VPSCRRADMVAIVKSLQWISWFMANGPGVMRHKSAAATMDQTDIRGLVTTVHVSVVEAASL
jgi:hypothetical protein